MSSVAIYQKIKRYAPVEDHSRLLNLQMKQKYLLNSRIRKLEAEANQLQIYHTPQHKSEAKARRFIQQSTFLPTIKKDSFYQLHQRRHSYGDFFNQPDLYGSAESDYEVVNQINQCQIIIQNLKKLANQNKNRAEKQFFTREPKERYSPVKPKHHYDQSARLSSIHQPSMMLRDETEDNFYNSNKTKRKSVLKKYSNIFQYTNRKGKGNGKESREKDKEEISNYDDFGEFQSRVKDQSIWEEQSNTQKIDHPKEKKRQLPKVNQQQNYGDASQLTNKNNRKDAESNQQKSNQNDDLFYKNTKDEKQWKQLLKKEQEELKKAQRRQNFLVKFLSKAKSRGFQLQRKITQHRIKNKSFIAKQQRKNPEQVNDNQNNKEDDEESHSNNENDKNQIQEKDKLNQQDDKPDQKESQNIPQGDNQEKNPSECPQEKEEQKQSEEAPQRQKNITTQQIALKMLEQNS